MNESPTNEMIKRFVGATKQKQRMAFGYSRCGHGSHFMHSNVRWSLFGRFSFFVLTSTTPSSRQSAEFGRAAASPLTQFHQKRKRGWERRLLFSFAKSFACWGLCMIAHAVVFRVLRDVGDYEI
jgi:hypothetical protein